MLFKYSITTIILENRKLGESKNAWKAKEQSIWIDLGIGIEIGYRIKRE